MSRVRINHQLAITIVAIIAVLVGAAVLKRQFDQVANLREGSAVRDAAIFISENAIERTPGTARFVPLPQDKQKLFDKQFRDRNDAPIIYDPWTPRGDLIVQSDFNQSEIVAYTLSVTPDGTRAIVTANLGTFYCDTPQKLGAPLRWIRHSKLETNHVEETSDFFGGV